MAERLPLAVPPSADGPKVRLGVLWFALLLAATGVAPVALAVVLAAVAALAADELLGLHDRHESTILRDPMRLPAMLVAASLPLAATAGAATLAGTAAVATVVVLAHRVWSGPVGGAIEDVSLVLVAAVPLGLGASAPVLLTGFNRGSAIVLLVLVAAYDAGNFLVGTGARSGWEGPFAGVVAVAVCGFGAWVVAPPPLVGHGVIALVVATAVLAPFGAPAASVLIGDAHRPARFVRRLDTLLLVGPVAAWAAAGVVATRVAS